MLDRDKLLALNGFSSTSRDINVATMYIGSSRPDTVRVLYQIKCDMKCYSAEEINDLAAFADISEVSCIQDEREVLFDLGATFEIENIEAQSSENNYIIIHMIPWCKGAHISRQYRQQCQKEIENSSAVLAFGALLYKTGKYMVAQRYFKKLRDNPNNENISDIYRYLGWTSMGQGDYEQVIINFEQAYDMIPRHDHISRARVLNSIGKAHVQNDYINMK